MLDKCKKSFIGSTPDGLGKKDGDVNSLDLVTLQLLQIVGNRVGDDHLQKIEKVTSNFEIKLPRTPNNNIKVIRNCIGNNHLQKIRKKLPTIAK